MSEQQMGPGVGGLKRMAIDALSGWAFLAVYLSTSNIILATAVGVACGVAQVGWLLLRRQKVDPMQWMVMVLIVGLGGATIVTHDPTFVVFKPTIFEAGLGLMMLRPGWMSRYAPSGGRTLVPRLSFVWGYVWAAAWFALAASSLVVAKLWGLKVWAVYTNLSPFALVGLLMALGMLVFPPAVRRATRARDLALASAAA